ncbi:MAG: uroporphyrin-III C-methyltransferase [Candidatus Syntrophoarchaeum caldarius]|uniref:precorrin-2 dehydrogenase n=1 Tax=Candidatus Syntropharchaeum caldarium TaxID=1838285 RepID=A0A1F2PB08_9EURY|nr:MAG: uroporphyrin-III C-methyltransferase [Candidatus Syntrophoarchaeum caldarius]
MVLMIPLLLDISNRKVVIFGGGRVGERKARLFAEYSDVEVISRDFTPNLRSMGEKGKIRLREITLPDESSEIEALIKDAFIVIPATDDDEINSRIIEVAKRSEVLVNSTGEVTADIIVPSVIRRGDITIAIATGGRSPAMSKFLRKRIEREITESDSRMSKLQQRLRAILKTRVENQRERERILWEVLEDQQIWSLLPENEDQALELALKKIE